MTFLRRSLLGLFSAFFLFTLIASLLLINPVYALSINVLGDYDNITVMEASGDYAALDSQGAFNLLPRQEVSRAFYAEHDDDYDFLVVLTDFDFLMPSPGAKAFFHATRNNVEGIGLELFDATHLYSADGSYLDRLEGMIDMANLNSHVLEPTATGFEETLQALTHETMHRWGAYLSFQQDGEESGALLGLGNAHWSFLLDAQGSSLYGNRWQDNGDGTFTSVAPEQSAVENPFGRILSPLDLYLMGLADKEQVPPLALIDSPGIDRNRLPEVGVTIPGYAQVVTMEQIVAAMGERYPPAEPDKTFRMAFILLVAPDSWSDRDPASLHKLRLINNLQNEWEKRFSVLTGGHGLVQTDLLVTTVAETNPGVTTDSITPHVTPHVNDGVNWLLAHQEPGGQWQDPFASAQRDTAAAVAALKRFSVASTNVAQGQLWLSQTRADNYDFLARKLLHLDSLSPGEIEPMQNTDGGWGSGPGYLSNPVDTALVLRALTVQGGADSAAIEAAIAYLQSLQGDDGGWSNGQGLSMVQPTAFVLLALDAYRGQADVALQSAVAEGLAWLTGMQNPDGGFGRNASTVYESATALLTLKTAGTSQVVIDKTVDYILTQQGSNGSWSNRVFETAIAVQALHAGTIQTDLQIENVDLAIHPYPVISIPSEVTLSAQVWNLGAATAENVSVALFAGTAETGSLAGETEISVPGNSFVNIEFPLSLVASGDVEYTLVVDQNDLIEEASSHNNLASIVFRAGEEPGVGFAVAETSAPESETASLDVLLSHLWDRSVTVELGIDPESTALPGSDYLLTPALLTFSPGETAKTIDLTIVNDTIPEEDETLILSLANPTNASLGLERTTYTILNDDIPPEVGFALTADSAAEDVGRVAVVVELSAVSAQDVTVDYLVEAASSSATPGVDALVEAGTLVFPAGETTATIALEIVDDVIEEPDEMLVLKLVNPAQALLGVAQFSYTIRDNDAPPQLVITSPARNEVYPDGSIALRYQSNLPDEQIEVYLNGTAVATRNGQTLEAYANGSYLLRLLATNVNGVVVEAAVSFEVDDSGQPPEHVWQSLLQGELAGGKRYTCLKYAADGSVYAVKNVESESLRVFKFDLNQAVHWTEPFPPDSGSYNYCKDAIKTDDAYVVLDSTSLRWFSDAANAYGLLSHNVELPLYADSSPWSQFSMDQAGHYFLAGATREGISSRDLTDGGHIQLAKMDMANKLVWRQVIATDFTDTVADIAVNAAGDIYLFGNTDGYLGEEGGSHYGGTDVFLIKLDTDGQELWRRQWGTSLVETGSQMVIDSQGNLVLTGSTYGSFDGAGPTFEQDAFVIKVAPDGSDLWLIQDHGISAGEALTLTGEDDIVIAGWYGQKRSGYNVNLGLKWSRYSAAGEPLWNSAVSTGSGSYNDAVAGLAGDPYGNLFISTSYLYENYTTYHWESRGALNRYKTGMDYSPPLLTVEPFSYDPINGTLELAGRHEYLADLTVAVDSSAQVTTTASRYSTAWTSGITGILPGQHRIRIQAGDDDGVILVKRIDLDIASPTPYTAGTTLQYGSAYPDLPLASAMTDQDQLYLVGSQGNSAAEQDVALWKLAENGSMTPLVNIDRGAQEQGQAVTVDAAGHIYMAWNSGENAYVSKYADHGGELWTSDYASRKGVQKVNAVAVDAFGNVYITGSTSVSPDRNVSHGGGQDYFLVKYDSHGTYQWSRLAGPGHPGDQIAYDLALDSLGHIYLVGSTSGLLHGVSAIESGFIVKYDSDGNLQWADVIEGHRPGSAKKLVVDASDNLYLLGEVNDLTGRDLDMYLLKYDSAGLRQWYEKIGGPYKDLAGALSLDQAGHLLVTGLLRNSLQNSDIYWARYDRDGHLLWHDRFDAGSTDTAVGIHETRQGDLLLTGSTNRILGEGSYGSVDLFVRQFQAMSAPELTVAPVVTPRSSQNLLLTGQVTPGAVVSVQVAEPSPSSATVGTVSLDQVSGSWTCPVANLVENSHNLIRVQATSAYGSVEQTVSLYVDTLAPILTIDPIASPADSTDQLIAGTTEAGAVLTVSVPAPSSPQGLDVSASGQWSYQALLNAGDNLFTFTASDFAGNQTIKQVTIHSTAPPAMRASLSRDSINSDEETEVILSIVNLASSAEVLVEEFIDVNGNGLIDDGEPLIRTFTLQDEIYSDDLNIQGDEALLNMQAAEGTVMTTLNYLFVHDLYHAPGRHLFRISDGVVEQLLPFAVEVANQQQVSNGFVLDDQGEPVPGAIIRGLDNWGRTFGYVCSDDNGAYSLGIPGPGEYRLVPFLAGHVYDKTINPPITVASGEAVNQNLIVEAVMNGTVGLIRDSAQARPIPGVLVKAENARYVGYAWSDLLGSYELALPDGDYQLSVDLFAAYSSSPQGVYAYDAPLRDISVAEDSTLAMIDLNSYQTTCLWTVRDQFNNAMPGIPLDGVIDDGSGRAMHAVSDGRGWYSIAAGLYPNNWLGEVSLNDPAAQLAGYVGDRFAFAPWDCSPKNLTVYPIDAWVAGSVTDAGGQLFANLPLELSSLETGARVAGRTNAEGHYQLGVHSGDWDVSVVGEIAGFEPLLPVQTSVLPGQINTVDFVLNPVSGPLELAVNPVQSPVNTAAQTISGTVSMGASVAVVADTTAVAGPVTYPDGNTWLCSLSDLSEGDNNFTITAQDNSGVISEVVTINYQPDQQANTIVVTAAQYTARKNTLSIDATSDYPDAGLMVEYAGLLMPMTFDRLFKGKYRWSHVDTNLTLAPESVTVSGPEGRVISPIVTK